MLGVRRRRFGCGEPGPQGAELALALLLRTLEQGLMGGEVVFELVDIALPLGQGALQGLEPVLSNLEVVLSLG